MKISRWFAILAFLGLSSSSALADSIPDPGTRLKQGGLSTGLFSPSDPNFFFTVNGGGGVGTQNAVFQEFDAINAMGKDATGLNLDINLLPGTRPLSFVCQDGQNAGLPYFTSCMVITESATETLIQFRGPDFGEGGFGGIPHATDLTNVSQCSDGDFHFCSTATPGADFIVQMWDINGDLVNLPTAEGFTVRGFFLVPEPSTVLLLLAGLVSLFLFRRAVWIPDFNVKP